MALNDIKVLQEQADGSLKETLLTAGTISAVGGSTGSTDNAILRANGTGGATVQACDLVIDDATASTQGNVAILNVHSATNSAIVLTPKGAGPLVLGPKPDGTGTGGNARGQYAVDLQVVRSSNTLVASGNYSVIAGGRNNIATGIEDAVLSGGGNQALGTNGAVVAGGRLNRANGVNSAVCGGYAGYATGNYAFIGSVYEGTASGEMSGILSGALGLADRGGIQAHAYGSFTGAQGTAQRIRAVLRCKTTTNSAVEMFCGFSANVRLAVPSGKVMAMLINITGVKSDGSAVSHYVRQFALKNVGGTTSQVYAPVTIGTDNAAGTSIAIDANDTNDALRIQATGVTSETWRWVASIDAVEVVYGT